MYVLIPLLFSAICSFVNPYVGLFSMFTIVEIIIIFCVDINANIRMRQSRASSAEDAVRAERMGKSGEILATAECIFIILFTVITTVVSLGVWMLASGSLTGDTVIMTPLRIVPEDDLTISCMLLIAGILFQIIAMVLGFARRKQLIR